MVAHIPHLHGGVKHEVWDAAQPVPDSDSFENLKWGMSLQMHRRGHKMGECSMRCETPNHFLSLTLLKITRLLKRGRRRALTQAQPPSLSPSEDLAAVKRETFTLYLVLQACRVDCTMCYSPHSSVLVVGGPWSFAHLRPW